MATQKHPNRNVKMPMDKQAVEAARDRAAPQGSGPPRAHYEASAAGRGSRREVGRGEWIDDRVMEFDKPASPSADTPPVWDEKSGRSVPGSYDPLKVYSVSLGSSAEFAGRMLSPGKEYQMVGAACTSISAAIIDAVELGDIPADPDSPPS